MMCLARPLVEKRELMETAGASLLVDLTEDILSCILSYLRPADVCACSRACKRLRELCREEGKVWRSMCERRWGSVTNICRWGNGRIPHRLLYRSLARWEHLIGFWRGVGNGGVALFEWAPHCIVGQKVVPAHLHTYAVRKIPFLWMTISPEGQVTCFLEPTFKTLRMSDGGGAADDARMALGSAGMLAVDVHFVGNHHLVIEEKVEQSGCALNERAEAATVAAFGSSHNLSPAACGSGPHSNITSPYSSSSETESCTGSPPGSFQYEMYQFLVSKVASTGGDRATRKQKRRDKERAWSHGKCVLEPEHFVKVVHASPTKARPLQGLWKGFFDTVGLDFVLVSYDDKDRIVCRKVQNLAGMSKNGSVLWTSESATRIMMPEDEAFYNSRTHTRPLHSTARLDEAKEVPFEFCEEVIGILCTSSCDFQSLLASNNREGRIWQYANGTFGFGYLHSSSVVDFRALCSDGSLLDTLR